MCNRYSNERGCMLDENVSLMPSLMNRILMVLMCLITLSVLLVFNAHKINRIIWVDGYIYDVDEGFGSGDIYVYLDKEEVDGKDINVTGVGKSIYIDFSDEHSLVESIVTGGVEVVDEDCSCGLFTTNRNSKKFYKIRVNLQTAIGAKFAVDSLRVGLVDGNVGVLERLYGGA